MEMFNFMEVVLLSLNGSFHVSKLTYTVSKFHFHGTTGYIAWEYVITINYRGSKHSKGNNVADHAWMQWWCAFFSSFVADAHTPFRFRRFNIHCRPTTVADCAACAQGFAPGVAFSCRKCSGSTMQSAIGLAVVMFLVVLPMAALLFSSLGSLMKEGEEEEEDEDDEDVKLAQRTWKQRYWSWQRLVVKMLPLTAIKIVVTVWQIISQVCYMRILQ